MGRSYLFECPKCSYKSTVSGGADAGLDCAVQTVVCRDCRKLLDAIVRLRVVQNGNLKAAQGNPTSKSTFPPPFEHVLRQLPLPTSQPFHWADFPLRCPVSATHTVERWNNPGKCPKCGAFLEKGGLPFRIWG